MYLFRGCLPLPLCPPLRPVLSSSFDRKCGRKGGIINERGRSPLSLAHSPFGICRNSPDNFPTDEPFPGQRLDDTELYYSEKRPYWGSCIRRVNNQLSPEYQALVSQSNGCLASALARLVADVGKASAMILLERECGHDIPRQVIEEGLLRKAKFAHMR